MAITKKQQEIDVLKWEKSNMLGRDACGTFDFCVKCDKSLENPCDKAFKKFNAKPKKAAAKKPATKKTAEKKPAAKKTVAKKK